MLEDLINISRYYGADPEYIIAGGGNTSYKDDNTIWVKASGISLKTITEEGFVDLSRKKLQLIENKVYNDDPMIREQEVKADLYHAVISSDKRPSVETSLHNIMDYAYVVHTHPTRLNGVLCSDRAKELCLDLFGEEVLFVEYTDPGYTLFKKVFTEIRSYQQKYGYSPKIIFLENHGVFVGADTTSEVKSIYNKIEDAVNYALGNIEMDFGTKELSSAEIKEVQGIALFENKLCKGFRNEIISYFVDNEINFEKISRPYTPDHIVYCKSNYLYLKNAEDRKRSKKLSAQFLNKYGYEPKVVAVKNVGLFIIDESENAIQTVFEVYYDMMKVAFFAERFGVPKPMNDRQIDFIDNWEVENYRRQMQNRSKA